jgi:hypothetical protein
MAHAWRQGIVEHRTSAHQNDRLLMAESSVMLFVGIAATDLYLWGFIAIRSFTKRCLTLSTCKKNLLKLVCIYVRGVAKIFRPYISGYKVDTYCTVNGQTFVLRAAAHQTTLTKKLSLKLACTMVFLYSGT